MSDDGDEVLAVVVFVAIAAAVLPYILAAALALALVVGVLWGLWRLGGVLVGLFRGNGSELDRVDDERDAAVRDLIALRHRAVREMVEVSREDFIEGTAREVDRR